MGPEPSLKGQTKVATVGSTVLSPLEPQGCVSGFIFFILLHAFTSSFLSTSSSDQKIPESSPSPTPPETLQLKTEPEFRDPSGEWRVLGVRAPG